VNGTNYEVPHCGAFSIPIIIPLGPNIRLRILFSNTLSLYSSLNVRDHFSQPYSTTGYIIVLYISRMADNATLSQFFALHLLLPFIIAAMLTFKYLDFLLTNQKSLYEEIKCSYKAENLVTIQSEHFSLVDFCPRI